MYFSISVLVGAVQVILIFVLSLESIEVATFVGGFIYKSLWGSPLSGGSNFCAFWTES